MKITVLVDNTRSPSRRDLPGEHGLSLLIETAHKKILFDSGASDLFTRNARAMGIDLGTVDTFVLSHGHYDHGGGLAAFLRLNDRARVFMGPGALDDQRMRIGILSERVGLNRRALEPFSGRFIPVSGTTEIEDGVFIVPAIPAVHPAPRDMGRFNRKTGGRYIPDDFSHEVLLAVREGAGMAVFTGCAHKGVLNIVAAAEAQFPRTGIASLFGGLHLVNPITRKLSGSGDDIRAMARALSADHGVGRICAGHCTGDAAFSLLKAELGDRLDSLYVGKQVTL